jgi:hypothetical protein
MPTMWIMFSFPEPILMPILSSCSKCQSENKEPEVSKPSEKEKALSLLLGKLVLNDVKVAYNNTAIAPTKQGMDFNH